MGNLYLELNINLCYDKLLLFKLLLLIEILSFKNQFLLKTS